MKCDIVKPIKVLFGNSDKYQKQVNLVDWHNVVGDDDEHVKHVCLDIRTWQKDRTGDYYPCKGISLSKIQAEELRDILNNLDLGEID